MQEFLVALETHANAKRRVVIDFSQTKRMFSAGTLLFWATLDLLNKKRGSCAFRCTYPRDPVVAQVLQHVGLFENMRHATRCVVSADNVRSWTAHSGTEVLGENAAAALAVYDMDPNRKHLYGALTEAMTNSVHHAYPGDSHVLRNWWMFSQCVDGILSVAICDMGVGIPASIRKNHDGIFDKLSEFIRSKEWNSSDVSLIRAAMSVGDSSTNQAHRGKGLRDMRSALDRVGGSIHIHSSRGQYVYRAAAGNEGPQEICQNYRKHMSIRGTVVLWQVPIPKAGDLDS